MATTRFEPSRQEKSFLLLAKLGLIRDLQTKKNFAKTKYQWEFLLNEIQLTAKILPVLIDCNFRNHRIRVTYTKKDAPRVFVLEPQLLPRTIHTWHKEDNRLCLYKPTNWQWRNDMRFDKELFPTTCLWLYYYKIWLDKGIWYGEEAEH